MTSLVVLVEALERSEPGEGGGAGLRIPLPGGQSKDRQEMLGQRLGEEVLDGDVAHLPCDVPQPQARIPEGRL